MKIQNQLLVTATGEDRPGIVARLSEAFVKHGANLQESRMALLGGEFAAIMLVSVPSERIADLNEELLALKSESILVTTKPTKPISPEHFQDHVTCKLAVSGADHEGIVHTVSSFLHNQAINIQSMESNVCHAPVSGTPLFSMQAVVQVPPTISLPDLRKSLAAIGDSQSVEIEVSVQSAG